MMIEGSFRASSVRLDVGRYLSSHVAKRGHPSGSVIPIASLAASNIAVWLKPMRFALQIRRIASAR